MSLGALPKIKKRHEYDLKFVNCDVCGKEFRLYQEWVYKRWYYPGSGSAKLMYFCKYSCMCNFDKKQIEAKKKRKEQRRLLKVRKNELE